ncbi:hypothetical protein DQ87_003350 [Escherichia coli]|nr:hypothetical protein [Escherichia coli]
MKTNVATKKTGVFPAPAGINRTPSGKYKFIPGVPRASGDKPMAQGFVQSSVPCSPRQRG